VASEGCLVTGRQQFSWLHVVARVGESSKVTTTEVEDEDTEGGGWCHVREGPNSTTTDARPTTTNSMKRNKLVPEPPEEQTSTGNIYEVLLIPESPRRTN